MHASRRRGSRQRIGKRVSMLPGQRPGRPAHCASASAPGCRRRLGAVGQPAQKCRANSVLSSPSPIRAQKSCLIAGANDCRVPKALLALVEVPFPAVSDTKPVMEELVGFLPWNLEADKAFAGDNGQVALTAVDDCCPFHGSPPELCLLFRSKTIVDAPMKPFTS